MRKSIFRISLYHRLRELPHEEETVPVHSSTDRRKNHAVSQLCMM